MIDPKALEDMAQKLSALMPPSVERFQEDIEKNVKAGLQGVMSKMDLVTREEYDVQVALLERSRERLNALEARIAELEKPAS